MPRRRWDDAVHFSADIAEPLSSANCSWHVSADGPRLHTGVQNVRPLKRQRQLGELGDAYADWTPVPDDDPGDAHAVADTVSSFDIVPDEEEPVKQKRYASSLDPMSLWRPMAADIGEGLLRRAGLGDYLFAPACTCCGASDGLGKSQRVKNGTLGQLLGNAWYPATTIDPETCATFGVLEWFRLQNIVGNVTAQDFVGALERKMDPLRVSSVPDRYKVFARMARQFSFLLMVIRAGLLHTTDGLRNTTPGVLAVLCWACPADGKNLPEGWRDVDPKYKFLFMLILAIDTNFRLKNRLRANELQNPSLGSGLGYMVEEKKYHTHLKDYVAESDVSTYIAFAALLQKETRITTGLRCSGVGGCVCTRHGVVCPQGLGDLQKGERYANMDYIVLMALMGVTLLAIALFYDIMCQWKRYLAARAKKIEGNNGSNDPSGRLRHRNSLSYAEGEMGKGAQHDAIENKVDHMNFEKNVGQGDTLARKLIVAIAERDKQVSAFHKVDSTINDKTRSKWTRMIKEWQADMENKPNPYCLAGGKGAGPTEAAVLLELKTAEAKDVAEGRETFSSTNSTPTAFIKSGLQLEELQRRIKAEVKGVTLVTADRASQIEEMRIALHRKLRTFECLQTVFMPGAEDVKLWLPSAMGAEMRRLVCKRGVAEVEAKLRRAQCVDALDTSSLNSIGDANWTGGRQNLQGGGKEESDAVARKKLARLGLSKRTRMEPMIKKTFSWIWTVGGGPDEEDAQLHEGARSEGPVGGGGAIVAGGDEARFADAAVDTREVARAGS
ncbi:hypothetical protein B0H14DRAFT_3494018 [Mycena olivaceomarginata]|nr:hypothetical protein B0H14DRAFT_3494018 [Mycena olivaceomarginata]